MIDDIIDWDNEEECIQAVKGNAFNLEYVDTQTERMCLIAVRKRGMAIAFVHNKTLKLCLEAYKNDSFASQDIPYDVKKHKEFIKIDLEKKLKRV